MALELQTNFKAFRDAIISWVQTYSGLPANRVLLSDQSTSKLTKPYATIIEFSPGSDLGLPIENYFFDEIQKKQYLQLKEYRIQLEFFSDTYDKVVKEASDYMNSALATIRTDEVRETFNAVGLAFLNHSNPIRLDEIFEYRWERRTLVDLLFLIQTNTSDLSKSQDTIDTVVMDFKTTDNLINDEGIVIGNPLTDNIFGILDFSTRDNSEMLGVL